MRDATETPTVLKSCTTNAFTALQFLFLDSDHYLTILDIDPQEFRRRLIEQMYQKGDKSIGEVPDNLKDCVKNAEASCPVSAIKVE
jgi:ferredoxin